MSDLEKRIKKAIEYADNGDPIKDAGIMDYELIDYIVAQKKEIKRLENKLLKPIDKA